MKSVDRYQRALGAPTARNGGPDIKFSDMCCASGDATPPLPAQKLFVETHCSVKKVPRRSVVH